MFPLQLGVALGFLLPPLIVQNHDDLELVGRDFKLMFYMIAGFTTLLVTLVVLCKFEEDIYENLPKSYNKMLTKYIIVHFDLLLVFYSHKIALFVVFKWKLCWNNSFPSSATNTAISSARGNTITAWIITILTFHQTFILERELHSVAHFVWNECGGLLCHFDSSQSGEYANEIRLHFVYFFLSSKPNVESCFPLIKCYQSKYRLSFNTKKYT